MLFAKLNTVLEKETAGFIDSLQLSGIDVSAKRWDISAVEYNAQVGAKSLIHFATSGSKYTKLADAFLQVTIKQMDAGEYFSAMAWIYAAYEWAGHFPPYAIIQHMIDPMLFCEYCAFLQKYLHKYLQGYFSCTVNIV